MSEINTAPLVSILTPSYNSAHFIEETISSVHGQDYSPLEHIVIDGGSTDGTVDILRRYPHLRWLSEPDAGQSDALNKGLALAKGEIIGWLNADDLYEPGAVSKVMAYFGAHPAAQVVYGNCTVFGPQGEVLEYWRGPYDHQKLLEPWHGFHGAFQPSIFYTRDILNKIGGWAVDLHYVMDYDILLKASEFCQFDYLDADLSRFRRHSEQKGAQEWHKFVREFVVSVERFWRGRDWRRYWLYRFQVRHFYALALLELITKAQLSSPELERQFLWRAVRVAPTVLRYPWVRRRCLRELLGPRLAGAIDKLRKRGGNL